MNFSPSAVAIPRIVRRPKASKLSIGGVLFIVSWLLLVAIDSNWHERIPAAAVIRFLFPVVMIVIALAGSRPRWNPTLKGLATWMFAVVVCGTLSSLLCAAPILGFLKLALFLAVTLPICFSPSLIANFLPGSVGLWKIAQIGLVLEILSGIWLLRSPGGIFWNGNLLGAFAVYLFPIMLYFTTKNSPQERRLGKVGAFLCLCLCLAAHCRGGTLALLSAIVTFVFLKRRIANQPILPVICAAVMVAAFAGLFLADALAEFAYKNRTTLLDAARQKMLDNTLVAFSEHPILGYGFGLSSLVKPEDIEPALRTGRLSWFVGEFGNSTLAILAGGGLALAIALYGLFAWTIVKGMHSFNLGCKQSPFRELQLSLLAGIVGLLVHAQLEGWMLSPLCASAMFFWLYVSASIHLTVRGRSG